MEPEHRRMLSLLDDLLKPVSTVKISEQENHEQLTINAIFSNVCDRFNEQCSLFSVESSDDDPYWRYIQIHLNLLDSILPKSDEISSIPFFSVNDELIIKKSFEIITLLGLVLHFDDGLYLSIEKCLKNVSSSIHIILLKTKLNYEKRIYRLAYVLKYYLKWIIIDKNNSSYQHLLIKTHLLEIIIALFQLLYSPNLKYSNFNLTTLCLEQNLLWLKKNIYSFVRELMLLNRLLSSTANSPVWLKKRCGEMLTSVLLDDGGVNRIIQTLLETTMGNIDGNEWKLYENIANIISTCPKNFTQIQYLERICEQIIALLHDKNDKRYVHISCVIINELIKKYPRDLLTCYIFRPLFSPFYSYKDIKTNGDKQFFDELVLCGEEQFEKILIDLDRLVVQTQTKNNYISEYLQLTILFELIETYFALEKTLAPFKKSFLTILSTILSFIDVQQCSNYLQQSLFESKNVYTVRFVCDNETNGFQFVIANNNQISNEVDLDDLTNVCHLVKKLLLSLNNDRLIVCIFLDMLKTLFTPLQLPAPSLICSEIETQKNLLQIRYQIKRITFLNILVEYIEQHIDLLLKNVDDTIHVLQILLEQMADILNKKYTSDDADEESLQMIFAIATLLITHHEQLSHESKTRLSNMYPLLELIEKKHLNSDIVRLAKELKIAFVTFGAVVESTSTQRQPLIEEIRDIKEESYDNAIELLNDDALPLRAHGLILFRRLLEKKDAKTLSKVDKLFDLFQKYLQEEDSYIYLAAINALCALADRYTDKVLPLLCHEYTMIERKLEDKLKVGEVLVKVSKLLGDITPKYSTILINTFLNASKHNDTLYRASALSNLGQICQILKYSLRGCINEILMALKCYLSIHEVSDVRRSSILVVELLCQGLDKNTWLLIDNELPSLYKLLLQLYKNDKDDIVKLHAQIALDSLNFICKDYLKPNTILEKEIRIS